MDKVPLPRHDLLPAGYRLGSIQTTRGCQKEAWQSQSFLWQEKAVEFDIDITPQAKDYPSCEAHPVQRRNLDKKRQNK